MTRNPFTAPFTGDHLYAAGVAWSRLAHSDQDIWNHAARQHAARGAVTNGQAEFMADHLNKLLRQLKRKALR